MIVSGPNRRQWLDPAPILKPTEATNTLPEAITTYVNAVYYPNYRVYRDQPPASLNYAAISHVIYAFASVNSDGTICLTDEWADSQIDIGGDKGCIASLVAQKLKPNRSHLKILISIGGAGKGSENFDSIASSSTLRQHFATSARTFVDQWGFDGVDIDWEHPSDATQGASYISLLSILRSALPSPRYLLTSALPAGEWILRNIDISRASSILDFINLMAYDFAGPWSHQPVHHAALYPDSNTPGAASADSAIQYLLAQPNVSPRKIVLGVPCYGRAFAHAPNTIPPLSATDRSREDHGRAIEVRDLPLPGAGEYVDERACAAYCLPEDGNGEWVSYDNPTTVAAKARYVRERNLGGLVFWEACQDHQAEERSLVLAGYVGLYGLGVGMGKIENVASK